jgi:hypothetical protein
LRVALCIAVALLVSFWVGGMNSLSALRDADTCWLLALGKIIASHGLPSSDPFSYTFYLMTQMGIARPFVMHQWLSELLLFLTYQTGGLGALILLVSTLTSLTFIVLPGLCLRWARVDTAVVLLVGSLAQRACAFHFFARPEIFSYLLFALAIDLVTKIIRDESPKQTVIALIALYAALTAFWCNLHSSFVLAIILSILPLTTRLTRRFFKHQRESQPSAPLPVAFFLLPPAAFLASLANPAGVQLWSYLPKLFFFNIALKETRSLAPADLANIELYPFFAFFIFYLLCLFRSSSKVKGDQYQLHLYLGIIATTLACARIRLIVYALIIVAFELPQLLSALAKTAPVARSKIFILLGPLACICGSLYVSLALRAPELPQTMPGFAPPFQAIAYLNAHRPEGPVLNDARFGDMMIWYLKPPTPVFIDTRFDMYGDQLFAQYANLNTCGNGWQTALQNFGIAWVFVPPDRPIARALAGDPLWTTVYRDDRAVILVKK